MKVSLLPSIDKSMKEILSGSGTAFLIKSAAAVVTFAFNVVLARLLGASDLGLFYLCLTCCSIAAIVGQFGLGQVILRYVAGHSSRNDWSMVAGLVRQSLRISFCVAMLAAALMLLLAPWLAGNVFHEIQLTPLLRWMALAVVPGTLFVLYGFALQGLCRITDSLLVSGLLMPSIAIVAAIILIPLAGVQGGVWGYCGASFCTLLIARILWRRALPAANYLPVSLPAGKLFAASLPLFVISLSQLVIVWSSNITLGMYASTTDVALFNAANRTAMLVAFVLASVNTISAPKFAAIYSNGDTRELASVAIKTTKIMLFLALPILLFFLVFPKQIMAIFGPSFTAGSSLLVILAIGQFINVTTGSVGYLLTMSGREKIMRKVMVFSAVLIVVLNVILIPLFGVLGAALATAITLSVQNILATVAVWKYMGIITIPYLSLLVGKDHRH